MFAADTSRFHPLLPSLAPIFTARKRSLGQGNVLDLLASVLLSTGGGGLCQRGLPGQRPLPQTENPSWTETSLCGKERAVRILLECILVLSAFEK